MLLPTNAQGSGFLLNTQQHCFQGKGEREKPVQLLSLEKCCPTIQFSQQFCPRLRLRFPFSVFSLARAFLVSLHLTSSSRPHDYLTLRGCEQYKLTSGGTPLYSLYSGFWPLSVLNSKGYIIRVSLSTGYCLHDWFELLDKFCLYSKYTKVPTKAYINVNVLWRAFCPLSYTG